MNIVRASTQNLHHVRKTVAFTGAAGLGAVGTVAVFTTTGQVNVVRAFCYCSVSLDDAGGTSTIDWGTTNDQYTFAANPTGGADAILTGLFWHGADNITDGYGASAMNRTSTSGDGALAISRNIILTVGTQAVTTGTLIFDIWYEPITDDGALAAA